MASPISSVFHGVSQTHSILFKIPQKHPQITLAHPINTKIALDGLEGGLGLDGALAVWAEGKV